MLCESCHLAEAVTSFGLALLCEDCYQDREAIVIDEAWSRFMEAVRREPVRPLRSRSTFKA